MKPSGLMQIFDSCPKDEVFLEAIKEKIEDVARGRRILIGYDDEGTKLLAEAAFKAVKEVLLKALPVPYEGAI